MSWNHLHHDQASTWQSSSSILNQPSESKNTHKNCSEHTALLRNTPTDISTQLLSAILLEEFDRKVPLRKEWPEKLTTNLCLLKSCKSSDLQKIRREILHLYELWCRCWHLGYSALTELPILLVKEWMLKGKKAWKLLASVDIILVVLLLFFPFGNATEKRKYIMHLEQIKILSHFPLLRIYFEKKSYCSKKSLKSSNN